MIFIFFYQISIGFGEAVIEATEGVEEARINWKNNDVNPIDSIQNGIIEKIDSLKYEKEPTANVQDINKD